MSPRRALDGERNVVFLIDDEKRDESEGIQDGGLVPGSRVSHK